jgi:trigger factor
MSTHTHTHNINYNEVFSVEQLPKSEVKISGELPFEEVLSERKGALKKLGKNIKIDGFRTGHIPDSIIEKHVGEMPLLVEMAERAIQHHYAHIIEAHHLDVIGYPKIEITKIAPNNPLGFSATVAVLPKISLPDYRQIASKVNNEKPSNEVTEEEVKEQIDDILRRKVAFDRLQNKASNNETLSDTEPNESPTLESEEDLKKLPLPELNDDMVKTLGQPGQFNDVEDFKSKIREHLEIEKKRDVAAKHRSNISDAIIKDTVFEVPQILIESELKQMLGQMESDLERAHLKLDDYLQHIKKTKESLLTEWAPAAENRARLQIILNEIAKAENIQPDQEQLSAQVNQLLAQYKNANQHQVKVYVSTVMTNEAVLQLLESQ